MWKRMLLMLLVLFLIAGGVWYWKDTQTRANAMGSKFAPPPTTVTTVVVKAEKWQPVLNAVGSLKAVNSVTVSPDIAGIVEQIAFDSGTPVKKGDLLVKLDSQQEEAQLRSAEARLRFANADVERKRELVAKKAIADSDWDTAQSQLLQAQAAVEDMKALVARKRLTAPFDGMLGVRMVSLGQYINPGAAIVPLQSLDPIFVEFAVPQQSLVSIAVGKKLRLAVSGVEGKFEGEITAIDSMVDPTSRNILIQGTVKNAEHKLRHGMFADVEVLLPETEGVLAIPSSSIAYAPYGDSIYVLRDKTVDGKPVKEADGKAAKVAEQVFVRLGPKRGDQVAVLSGLKDGDEVVSSGVFKLRPGAPVRVDNSVQPGNDPRPKPANT